MLFSQLIIGAVVLAPFGVSAMPQISWENSWVLSWTLSWTLSGLVLASAAFSLLGNLSLIVASKNAPASSLAPIIYFQLIFVTLLGYFVFGSVPDVVTLLGLCVLVASGLTSMFLAHKTVEG